MRMLLVGAGASYSTKDVELGYLRALRGAGVDTRHYILDQRIQRSGAWLKYVWRKAGCPEPRPTPADIVYHASLPILERALRFEVDGVLFVSAMYAHPDVMILLRRAGIPTGVIFTESPYDTASEARVAPLVDACWTNERTSVPILRQANPRTYYLPPAYDPALHRPDSDTDADVPSHDVVFVGTGFQERIDLLSAVDWTGIDFGLYGPWELLGSRSRLRTHLRGGVTTNAHTAALYRKAKIGLNLHRSSIGFGRTAPRIGHAESLNPRAYELAACGVFHLSDARAEVAEIFGGSVPTFDGPEQLGVRIRGFLPYASRRAELAQRAREAIAPHTYAARAAQLLADWHKNRRPMLKGA